MKIIFLDNDGVICLYNTFGSRYKKRRKVYTYDSPRREGEIMPVDLRFDSFDKKAIIVLNYILLETDAEIVVSSDWKLSANLQELGDYYEAQGIIKRPIAFTPNLNEFDSDTYSMFYYKQWFEKIRILEINQYLKLNPNITKWVAVDDMDLSPQENGGFGLESFVKTPRVMEGIKQVGIREKITNILNNETTL